MMQTHEPNPAGAARFSPAALKSMFHSLPWVAESFSVLMYNARHPSPTAPVGLQVAVENAITRLSSTLIRALDLPEYGPEAAADVGGHAFSSEPALVEHYGFIPRLFQLQSPWPEIVASEARLLEVLVFNEDPGRLPRADKEFIMLAAAVANRDTYLCALHFQVLELLGESDRVQQMIARERHERDPLCCFAAALSDSSKAEGSAQTYWQAAAPELSQTHYIEAAAVCAVANFLHELSTWLGAAADFPLPHSFADKVLYPAEGAARPTHESERVPDPDAQLVAQVTSGQTDAFAELVRRHSRKVFATLFALLNDSDDARDVSQEVFLKAFEHIKKFEGRSKFSSWLISIAINTGTEALRNRRIFEPIEADDDEEWRPRQIQDWADDPEECLARQEVQSLVREGVMRLPQKYRLALLLRDVNQFSTEDAADAMGLSIPALKARVLRGRLMLRETLAPHFLKTKERGAHG